MSGRLQRLFLRYAARHLRLRAAGQRLHAAPGVTLRSLSLAGGWLTVDVETAPGTVIAELDGYRREAASGGGPLHLRLPDGAGLLSLHWQGAEGSGTAQVLPFSPLRRAFGRALLIPGFVLAGIGALPAARRWFTTHDMAARAEVKERLGLGAIEGEALIEPSSLRPLSAHGPAPAAVTVILPVHNAAHLLPEVLARLARNTDLPWRAVLIEDASTDAAVRPLLHRWRDSLPEGQRARVEIIEHEENKGFIASVNEGLQRALGWPDPVLLLNSDAFLPAGWAARLLAPLAAADVASVTPMSNDAELCSVPVICHASALAPGEGDALDRTAAALGALPAPAAPTGVGFCMLIARPWLDRLPQFDPVFGRGYGEEVDWCQRVQAMGGRHLCLPNLFVEHRGGQSFGSAAKAEALRRNGALVSARHPRFDGDVQRFIAEDPLRGPRLALGLAWAARSGAEITVTLAHALGGGAEMDLHRRIRADLGRCGASVVLRVGSVARWRLELHTGQGITAGATEDFALIRRLVGLLPRRRIVYSCGVGDRDPAELPSRLLELAEGGHPVGMLIHDYLPVSPSYTLLDQDNGFNGTPPETTTDPRHIARRPDGTRVPLAQWRADWGRLVAAAEEVTVFSDASARLVGAAFPAARIMTRPHPLLQAVPRLPAPRPDAPPVIGVLGNIAPQKGAALLSAISRLLRRRKARLVLVGQLDPAFRLARPAVIHGSYSLDELPALVARHGITCWLIPSIWPETFSFATHEALATGLPTYAFDLGAQADALRAAGAAANLIPLGDAGDRAERVLRAMGF